MRSATEVKVPYLIIEAAYSADFSESQIAELLSIGFDRDPRSSFTLGLSGLYRKVAGVERAEAWLKGLLGAGASAEAIGALLEAWPDGLETWNVVRRFGPDVVAAYWKHRSPRFVGGSRLELLRCLIMLLRYERAAEAIQTALNRMSEVPSKLILRMLDGVIPQLNAKRAMPDTMMSFYVEKALVPRHSDFDQLI